MKRIKKYTSALMLLLGLFAVASCGVTYPYAVTNNPVGTKVGKSTTKTIFGIGANVIGSPYSSFGIRFNKNYGIAEAAKNGKITKVATVDIKYVNYVLFGEYTLIVTGE